MKPFLPWARSAASTILMSCFRPPGSAISTDSTRSVPAAPLPGRWSAAREDCCLKANLACVSAMRTLFSRSFQRLPSGGAWARCWLKAHGARQSRSAERATHWAMHVKGLELPGYEPRSLKTMALGLAVSPRGACHNRSGAYEADFSGEVDRLQADPAGAPWSPLLRILPRCSTR